MTLKDYRLKLQIITVDMADKLGIRPSEVCDIEKGKRPPEELLPRIMECYKIPEEEFYQTLLETESHYAENVFKNDKMFKIFSVIPNDLQKGETRILTCPICGKDTFTVSRSSYNGHLAVSCKCGIMIMQ